MSLYLNKHGNTVPAPSEPLVWAPSRVTSLFSFAWDISSFSPGRPTSRETPQSQRGQEDASPYGISSPPPMWGPNEQKTEKAPHLQALPPWSWMWAPRLQGGGGGRAAILSGGSRVGVGGCDSSWAWADRAGPTGSNQTEFVPGEQSTTPPGRIHPGAGVTESHSASCFLKPTQ